MRNIRLSRDEENNYWLEFSTDDGKQASLLIGSINRGPIVTATIQQWAKEEMERQASATTEKPSKIIEKLEEAINIFEDRDSSRTKRYKARQLLKQVLTALKKRDEMVVELLEEVEFSGDNHPTQRIPTCPVCFFYIHKKDCWLKQLLSLIQDQPCQTCGGSGKIKAQGYCDIRPDRKVDIPCPACQEKGTQNESKG